MEQTNIYIYKKNCQEKLKNKDFLIISSLNINANIYKLLMIKFYLFIYFL